METRIPRPYLHLAAFFAAYIAGLIGFAYLCGCSGQAFTASGGVVHETGDAASSGGATGTGGVSVGAGGAGGARATGGAHPTSGGAPSTGGVATATGGAVTSGGAATTGDAASTGGSSGDARAMGDAGGDAGEVCVTDLSGVGIGDFRISFTLTTTTVPAPATYMALLNQRYSCDDIRPGWDVWMTAQGNLGVEVFDGSGSAYDNVTDSRPINDGALHRVTVARSGPSLTINVDGVVNTYPNEPIMPLAALSPMNTGIDPMCTGVSNLSGRLIDVCLTKQ